MFQSIGFIGTGNMGAALARAADRGAPEGTALYLANRNPAKAEKVCRELAHAQTSTNEEIAQTCELIFLGVKPQLMGQVLGDLAPALAKRTDRFVLASMAAGLSIRAIQEMAGGEYPVICLMPNTPVAVGVGMIQYCSKGVSQEETDAFEHLMKPAGLVDRINEELMDASSALSGAGPAFCALLIEALADGGVACGLPRDKAQLYTAQMVKGAAMLMLETGIHPGALKDGVCSPGGTTIQGVRVLEAQGFRAAAMNAVIATYEKTLSLGKKT